MCRDSSDKETYAVCKIKTLRNVSKKLRTDELSRWYCLVGKLDVHHSRNLTSQVTRARKVPSIRCTYPCLQDYTILRIEVEVVVHLVDENPIQAVKLPIRERHASRSGMGPTEDSPRRREARRLACCPLGSAGSSPEDQTWPPWLGAAQRTWRTSKAKIKAIT